MHQNKTALYTGFDAPYAGLARLTTPLMRSYALLHGMDYVEFEVTPDMAPVGPNVYWTGICGGLQLLRGGYERVVYLDVDQVVTNEYATPWADLPKSGFHASKDWGDDAVEPWQFSMCGFVAHADCIPMFEFVLEMEPEWRDKPFQEQGPMQHVVKLWQAGRIVFPGDVIDGRIIVRPGWITVHPRKVFNAVPDQVCPGKVPEPWDPSCWCAHLTMADMAKRIEIFNEISTLPQQMKE